MNKLQLIERQQKIADAINANSSKREVMEYISMIGEDLKPAEFPTECRIAGCLSNTFFRVQKNPQTGYIEIEGYSQSVIMRGVIELMREAFTGCDAKTVEDVGITWVDGSGLMELLTPQRQGAIRQMAERIYRACKL